MTIKDIYCKSLWVQFLFLCVMGILVYNASVYAEDAEEWMPDVNLRAAVKRQLGLPVETRLTKEHTKLLINFTEGKRSEISDLTGLEYAVHLTNLSIHGNPIKDLTLLSNLKSLTLLFISGCLIKDVSPLAHLPNLQYLSLTHNRITDVTPLANLVNLKELYIIRNPILDYTPLLSLPNIEYMDWQDICDVPDMGIPVRERIESRTFPSIFGGWSELSNIDLPIIEENAYFDLYWHGFQFGLSWAKTPNGWKLAGNVKDSHQKRDAWLSLNSNSISLLSVGYFTQRSDEFPLDFPGFTRDESGNPRIDGGIDFLDQAEDIEAGEAVDFLLDFTKPEVQDIVVEKAIAVAECGVYDGIFLDHWNYGHRLHNDHTIEEEHQARDIILQRIRAAVPEDFLIIVNTNGWAIPRWSSYVNGAFIELDAQFQSNARYSREHLILYEDMLKWAENNYREPQINAFGIYNIKGSTDNELSRLYTTLCLTHSNAYMIYDADTKTGVFWDSFWDADLGRPVGAKGQLYDNRDGLFIREFTNGWAVYNRSGKEQQIEFSEAVSGVASGVEGEHLHTLRDLDGEIYLKSESGLETPPTADINGDGVVNIQDLVVVANAFGKAEPDLNGDGVVNIQDLVIVANAF